MVRLLLESGADPLVQADVRTRGYPPPDPTDTRTPSRPETCPRRTPRADAADPAGGAFPPGYAQDGLKAIDKATDEAVRQLLRNPPMKIDDDVRRHRSSPQPPAAPAPGPARLRPPWGAMLGS